MADLIDHPPVVIGGVGGSGTRVIAQMLIALGVFMGDRLNESNDNLRYGSYSGRILARLKAAAAGCSARMPAAHSDYAFDFDAATLGFVEAQVRSFVTEMHVAWRTQATPHAEWGWKVPGMFHLLGPLSTVLGRFKYVHVIRNGLDMAFSANQNQVLNWGWRFNVSAMGSSDPGKSLRYWARANRQAVIDADRYKVDLFVLNYDLFCAAPRAGIGRLIDFLGFDSSVDQSLIELVRPPASIGRSAKRDLSFVTDEDRAALREFGFAP
ncbi:MAG TPA: sulfotransferase [Caulobacteraceae bacterium]